jgi:signal transduction histidine kinase
LSDNIEKNANLIHRYGQRANAIIENMMYMMQSTQSRREWVDLNHLVDDCSNLELRSVTHPGEAKDARVVKFFSEDVAMVEVLPQRLSQALFNIITNALEALGEKQVTMESGFQPTIWVDTALEGEFAVVTFKDNGVAITEEQREEIFHPFFTTKSPNRGNVGLGLSIAYDTIVEEHKGSIRVNSTKGDFTEFVIKIPLRSPA